MPREGATNWRSVSRVHPRAPDPNSALVKLRDNTADGADDARADLWEKALRAAHGNSAEAARESLGANRQRGHYLTKRYGLQELARQLKAGKCRNGDAKEPG